MTDPQVPTIDVVTQESGPRLTLSQLADYLAQQAQQAQQGRQTRLLNVTSLVLAGTPLEVRFGGWERAAVVPCSSSCCSLCSGGHSLHCWNNTAAHAAAAPCLHLIVPLPASPLQLHPAHARSARSCVVLQGAVSPPAAVQELDLVSAVWPEEGQPDGSVSTAAAAQQRPETLLYALLGPAGAYTDWHVDMGGSAGEACLRS